ncbi:hypothetical protein EMIT0357P_120033 [Pseudomonas marginalis]
MLHSHSRHSKSRSRAVTRAGAVLGFFQGGCGDWGLGVALGLNWQHTLNSLPTILLRG